MANSEAGAGIGGAGRQRAWIGGEPCEREAAMREEGEADVRGSHPVSHRVRAKVRYSEVRKG